MEPRREVRRSTERDLYGTTGRGAVNNPNCYEGCGTIFKMTHQGAGWLLSTLYAFTGNADGGGSWQPVTFGPDGTLYGVTDEIHDNGGTVFRLQPPVASCRSSACPWTETVLFSTPGGFTGIDPLAPLIFDSAGNIYGAMYSGGRGGVGYAYELVKSDGWGQQMLHQFTGGAEGGTPGTNLILDSQGNLYGTAEFGGANNYGTVFQLAPQRGWQGTALYNFQNLSDGSRPMGDLIQDNAGNFYGTCEYGGQGSGTVWELFPGNGGWTLTTLYQFAEDGTSNGVTMDQAGNLYGTTFRGGANGVGNVFKLSPGDGGWTYTSLHDFTGGSDGATPSAWSPSTHKAMYMARHYSGDKPAATYAALMAAARSGRSRRKAVAVASCQFRGGRDLKLTYNTLVPYYRRIAASGSGTGFGLSWECPVIAQRSHLAGSLGVGDPAGCPSRLEAVKTSIVQKFAHLSCGIASAVESLMCYKIRRAFLIPRYSAGE